MHYINVTSLISPGWRFLEPYCPDPALSWEFHYGVPANRIERAIRRPPLSFYRAAAAAVRSAAKRRDAVLVSHLPGATRAVEMMRRAFGVDRPHIAFAFNYTDLPGGRKLAVDRRLFPGVREFVVPSHYEIDLYSGLFDLPKDRFRFLPWTANAPIATTEIERPFAEPYLCAIGSEARDYRTLARAMELAPELRMAIVARPYNLEGLSFGENVKVFSNLPASVTWGIARQSEGLVVPLRGAKTPNGHVTILSAQWLSVPLVITRSAGVSDYVDDTTALLCEGGSAEDLAAKLRALLADRIGAAERADRALRQVQERNSPQVWVSYFQELDARLTGSPAVAA